MAVNEPSLVVIAEAQCYSTLLTATAMGALGLCYMYFVLVRKGLSGGVLEPGPTFPCRRDVGTQPVARGPRGPAAGAAAG